MNIRASLDRNLCLKGVKSEAFLIILKISTFIGTVLMLTSPITKPFLQFTSFIIATGLPNTIQNNIAQRDDVLQPPI